MSTLDMRYFDEQVVMESAGDGKPALSDPVELHKVWRFQGHSHSLLTHLVTYREDVSA